ncbi:MAG: DUF3105 domain-containing protein, partial [Chloroflexi bacterium]|nr:DUF3105 domain-containing protein [Chloroflexota bacterium]
GLLVPSPNAQRTVMGMDQRQRRREGSQRAQASRERRVESRQKRKQRNIRFMVGGGVAIAAVVALLVFLLQNTGADVGYPVSEIGGQHNPPYIYVPSITTEDGETIQIPPTSGNHFGQQSAYGFLGAPLVPEAVAHNMEHGAVVIWYEPDNAELAAQVNQLIKTLGTQCLVAGSYADMSTEIAVTGWGRVLPQRVYNESEVRSFIIAYRGELGPEAGICRGQS